MNRSFFSPVAIFFLFLVFLGEILPLGAQENVDLAKFDGSIKSSDRDHWAYQPVRKPTLPRVQKSAWVQNPIDAFILAGLETAKMQPAPTASPSALLRRVHLDLTGLPPTLAEQEAFLGNPSSKALDKVLDDLLARPTYGERWARHWLDLVRYAETCGYERDAVKPWVWRYRDYVIRSFNDDKPYDRFIFEQLAGDELPDRNADTLVATGFLRLGPWDDEPADPKEDRFDQLDDIVNATSLTFLGLTVSCARCHDHKFEALTMHDYYRLVAIFKPLDRPRKGRVELDLPLGNREEFLRQNRRDKDLDLLTRGGAIQSALASSPFVTDAVNKALREVLPDLPRGYFFHEPSARPTDTFLLVRGKASRPGPKVNPGMPAVLVDPQPTFPEPGPETSLRRLTLARWIADAKNPLTARVMVNRVWQYHFGEGLVRTSSDFGVMGSAPTHPELLDWLASWFVENGWSLKKLHRLIMTSNTYRMSKAWNPEFGKRDPDNQNLWRFPYRRLEVEAIRDSILLVSGQLNPQMYGPSIYPEVPKEALLSHSDPDKIWKPFDEKEASRRTIYAHIKRSFVVPFLEVLDLCDATRPVDKRLGTTVAPQALTLFNGDFVNRQAKHFAQRLVGEVGTDADRQIERAFLLALCRPPTVKEKVFLKGFLERETQALQRENGLENPVARQRALEQVCRIIFNLNEFVYSD
jgi:hypothetical protein